MIGESSGSLLAPTDVVTLGETMALMKADTTGPLGHVRSFSPGIGGAESNVAIGLQRLGTSVTWAGLVGRDSLGDLVLRELQAEGIQIAADQDASAPTGLMIKERRTADSLKVWYYRSGSAGSRLAPRDIPTSVISSARLLHITGITPALSGSASEAIDHAISCARAAGTLVSFDLNYRSALWSKEAAGRKFRNIAAQADIVFAGEDEAAIAIGPADSPMEMAKRIADLGPDQVIIKLGPQGCIGLIDGREYRQDAVKIVPVDTVGAGDAFVAGYIADLLAGCPVQERLLTAVRTGAFACLVSGDWEGMPRRAELGLLDAREPVER